MIKICESCGHVNNHNIDDDNRCRNCGRKIYCKKHSYVGHKENGPDGDVSGGYVKGNVKIEGNDEAR